MIYDTEDPTLIAQINAEMKLIRDMVVVSELSFVASGAANAGFQVTLKCYAARQQQGLCRRKNVGPVRITRDRITLMDCLKELRRKLEEEHGSCISAVNEHAEIMQDNAPAASQDALTAMMDLSRAKQCLEKATVEWKNVKERADSPVCSRVRGRGHGANSLGASLEVPGCERKKLTSWKEDKFTVRAM